MRSCAIASRRSCSELRSSRCSPERRPWPRVPSTRRPRRTRSASSTRAPAFSGPTAPRRSRASSSGSSTRRRGRCKVNGKTLDITYLDDKGDAATGVTQAKDLIGQGVKILMGTGSSGVAVQIAPLAAQNQVLYISGPAAADAITGINKYTFRAGRQTIQDVLDAKSFLGKASGQEGRRLRPGQRVRSRQLRGGEGVLHRSQRHRDLGAAERDRLHAVRPAGEEREPRPALRRLGRHDGRRHVQDARPAGRLQRDAGRDRSRRAGDLGGIRRPGDQDQLPLALRLHRSEQQGQHLARRRSCASAIRCRTCSRRTASSRRRCSCTRCRRATTTSTR